MPDKRTPRSPTRLRHWANRTHRSVAIVAVSFLIIITLTGLVLNHADALGISNRGAAFLASVYGIDAPPVDAAFRAGDIVFASAADTLYANGRELMAIAGPIRGAAVGANGEIVVATSTELLLMTGEAVLVERAAVDAGAPILRLGTDSDQLVVATTDEHFTVELATMRLAAMDASDETLVSWSETVTPGEDQLRRIATHSLGKVLSWERVLIDLHSGRILPVVGRYIVDLAALCLLYLSMTGIIVWVRTRNPMQR